MTTTDVLSPLDIFRIAREVELNGQVFYKRAANECEDPSCKSMLLGLSDMEAGHAELFKELQEGLSEDERTAGALSPEGFELDSNPYRAFAAGHIFDLRSDPTEIFGTGADTRDVLKKAIELEKDTVIFYMGFRDLLASRIGAERVQQLINQEMEHVFLLSNYLRALS